MRTQCASALKLFLLAIIATLPSPSAVHAQPQTPELFTYAELVQLYETQNPSDALQVKLDRLLTTPFVRMLHVRTAPG